MRNKPKRDRYWKCPVPLCNTSAKRGFYTIPENPARREVWLKLCKLPTDIRKTAVICWKHFNKSDFQTEMDEKDVNELGMGLLKRNVSPSKCLPAFVTFDVQYDMSISQEETVTVGII